MLLTRERDLFLLTEPMTGRDNISVNIVSVVIILTIPLRKLSTNQSNYIYCQILVYSSTVWISSLPPEAQANNMKKDELEREELHKIMVSYNYYNYIKAA
jgi:hypothetical protein